MNPVFELFNDIAASMLQTEEGEVYLANTLRIQGASGTVHTLSTKQIQLLVGVLSGEHPFLAEYNPLEFLIFSYQIQDKFKANYLATDYQIIYDEQDNSIFMSGITKHPMCVEGHPEYVPGCFIPAEPFQENIPDVGLYGSLALVNCIAAQNEQFAPIRGAFGGSFIYEHKNGIQSVKKYEPKPLEELGIGEDELQVAIQKAKESVLPDYMNAQINGVHVGSGIDTHSFAASGMALSGI